MNRRIEHYTTDPIRKDVDANVFFVLLVFGLFMGVVALFVIASK